MILLTATSIAASALKAPEWELDQSEAKKISEAGAALLNFYQVDVPKEQLLWVNLAVALGSAVIPRIALTKMRMTEERSRNVTPQKEPVFHAPVPTGGPAVMPADGAGVVGDVFKAPDL